jgi:hypothetical protein
MDNPLVAVESVSYDTSMPKRSSNKKKDFNELAASIVGRATGEPEEPQGEKAYRTAASGAAATLGRLGGLKGGKARAEKLTAEQRSQIAKEAAEARWGKKSKG